MRAPARFLNSCPVPNTAYTTLLDAAIRHLEHLREQGVRHVSVDPTRLAALKTSPRLAPVARSVPAGGPLAPPRSAKKPVPSASRPPAAFPASSPPALPARPPATPAAAAPLPPAPATTGLGTSPDRPRAVSAPAPAGPVLPGTDQPSLFGAPLRKRELSPAEKETAMAELRQRALACRKCPHLVVARRNVVFGVGNIHAALMFVGEAPGMDEDAQGEPFVGKAGQLLTRIIQTMGLRREDVYIANILKCRPDTPGQTSGNRRPTATEMATCLPYLLEQIEIIRPRVIVALGATAVEGLFGKAPAGITRTRGTWLSFQDIPVMPTYHPAYLLRNQALTEKRKVWEDMLAVMEKLGLPISEKQRNYFLKA